MQSACSCRMTDSEKQGGCRPLSLQNHRCTQSKSHRFRLVGIMIQSPATKHHTYLHFKTFWSAPYLLYLTLALTLIFTDHIMSSLYHEEFESLR